jgi:hypothetical protein
MSGGALSTPPPVRPERTADESLEIVEGRGSGWVAFAATMLFIAGVLNVIYGIAAIDDSSFFVHNTKYILSGLNTWGWIVLIIGVVQVFAAIGIFAGNQVARWAGIVIAGLSIIAQLLWLPAYPLAALAVLAIDVVVLYGLIAYGGRHRAAA